jgi:hypothetical protein
MARTTRKDLEMAVNYLAELMGEPLQIYSYAPDSRRRYYVRDARSQDICSGQSHDLASVYGQVRFAVRCVERVKECTA